MSTPARRSTESRKKASRGARWALWSTLAVVTACGSALVELPSTSEYTTDTVTSSGGSTSTGSAGMDGLPCEVAALLATKCISCHGGKPIGGAPQPLVTYADLLAPSKSDPAKSNAVRSLERMKLAASPMPPVPAAGPSAEGLAAFEAWVDAGTPKGACGDVDAGPNPFDVPAQCTSMTMSMVDEGAAMNPGMACVKCHNGDDEAPHLTIGGTTYATAHEPDDCNAKVKTGPAISTAIVEITDKNGVVLSLEVNSVGNFYRQVSQGAVALPYTAKVKYDGRERVMATAQMSGDCNGCHTQAGTQDAPGRVLLP